MRRQPILSGTEPGGPDSGARIWANSKARRGVGGDLGRRDRYVAIAMASPSPARKTNAIVGCRPADDGHRAMSAEPRAVSGGPPPAGALSRPSAC
jgi:hypothetical protein